jgi:hypothetical protein
VMSEFDEKRFYDLGLKIARAYAHEAGYRTAIGRVYYACYLIGAKATKNKGWFSPRYQGTDHSALRRALVDQNKRPIADKLLELYKLREHSDYHVVNCPRGECEHCDLVAPQESLVGAQMWSRAETIAKDILPKLESIDPKKRRN